MKSIPAEFVPVISTNKLNESIAEIGAAIDSVLAAGNKKESIFAEKGPKLKRKFELEASIELTEAEAMMQIRDEGKSAHALFAGEKVYLTNEESRKAYKKAASKQQRQDLAVIEGELQVLELEIILAQDEFEKARIAASLVERRAFVQGNLLAFLAGSQ